MQFSITALVLALAAVAAAAPQDPSALEARAGENGNRPVASGSCCVANTSLKQDACNASNGQAGRCVPGGNACGSTLSCVAQNNLACDATIIERGKSRCRAKAANGGLFDGGNIIQSLSQAKLN